MILREQYPLPDGRHMNVFITQPDDVAPDERLPLIVFLHGAGERGDDYERLCHHGVPKLFGQNPEYDGIRAVTLSPQCPEGTVWTTLSLFVLDLIHTIADSFPVDHRRISLTGLSMGGFGTWHIACEAPELFSAISPLCGGGMSWLADQLRETPICVFHGDADESVPLAYSQLMVDAVRAAGGEVDFRVLPGVAHNCWTYAYEETGLLQWLSEQTRSE